MKEYIHDDFLLTTEMSGVLYHDYAKKMPLFDYHGHLNVKAMAENNLISDLGKAWLDGDHYKWRAVRASGFDEDLVSGSKTSWKEKFMAWAAALPNAIGNPIFQWTHMELKRYFNIDLPFNPDTAEEIFDKTKEMMQNDEYRPRQLLERMGVKCVSTTDDPVDSLEYHRMIRDDASWTIAVIPAFRPDKAIGVNNPKAFNTYMEQLGKTADIDIASFDDLIKALDKRHQFFHDHGCRFSDHALERTVGDFTSKPEIDSLFTKIRKGDQLNPGEIGLLQSAIMLELGKMNTRRGWVMQLHIAALRNNNAFLFNRIGPGAGGDSMADGEIVRPLARFLDKLDQEDLLPKTVLYTLNPMYNDLLAAVGGCFLKGPHVGKIQFGPPWWFNDTLRGLEIHFETLASIGSLGHYIGMTTDTNSFFAFTRHEYFRRILCRLLGSWVEKGEIPGDEKHLGKIVKGISYNNAKNYFDLPDLK